MNARCHWKALECVGRPEPGVAWRAGLQAHIVPRRSELCYSLCPLHSVMHKPPPPRGTCLEHSLLYRVDPRAAALSDVDAKRDARRPVSYSPCQAHRGVESSFCLAACLAADVTGVRAAGSGAVLPGAPLYTWSPATPPPRRADLGLPGPRSPCRGEPSRGGRRADQPPRLLVALALVAGLGRAALPGALGGRSGSRGCSPCLLWGCMPTRKICIQMCSRPTQSQHRGGDDAWGGWVGPGAGSSREESRRPRPPWPAPPLARPAILGVDLSKSKGGWGPPGLPPGLPLSQALRFLAFPPRSLSGPSGASGLTAPSARPRPWRLGSRPVLFLIFPAIKWGGTKRRPHGRTKAIFLAPQITHSPRAFGYRVFARAGL